jgi:beta-glucosidase
VVVVNTGSPVEMPWAAQAPALLQTWFGGQEMAEALVDVLLGDAEPGGRLPVTMPVRLEDNPSYGTFPGESGTHRYGEGVFVGYRWYDARALPVRFPFGHGLSYTTWELGEPSLSAAEVIDADELLLTLTLPVTNTGDKRGSEVVQCYVSPPSGSVPRPVQELRAFAKVSLAPGETAHVTLELGRRAFARWQPAVLHRVEQPQLALVSDPQALGPEVGSWVVDHGRYEIAVGRSSSDRVHRLPVDVLPGAEHALGGDDDNVWMHLT